MSIDKPMDSVQQWGNLSHQQFLARVNKSEQMKQRAASYLECKVNGKLRELE